MGDQIYPLFSGYRFTSIRGLPRRQGDNPVEKTRQGENPQFLGLTQAMGGTYIVLRVNKFNCRNHKSITQFQKILHERALSFITGRRLQSSLRSTTLNNFRPETFKGQKLKIVQIFETQNSHYSSMSRIRELGGNCWVVV